MSEQLLRLSLNCWFSWTSISPKLWIDSWFELLPKLLSTLLLLLVRVLFTESTNADLLLLLG